MRLKAVAAALIAGLCLLPASAADTTPPKIYLWLEGAPGAIAEGGEEKVRVSKQGDHAGHAIARFLTESGSDDRPEVLGALTDIFLKLRAAKVPAELHFYDGVPHGFTLRTRLTGPVANWMQQAVDWLKVLKFVAGESK